jgi:hypothetical protein
MVQHMKRLQNQVFGRLWYYREAYITSNNITSNQKYGIFCIKCEHLYIQL